MERIAIIGFGCAGYNGARALRASGFKGEIHVYESTQEPPANPMLTTYYVSGKLKEKDAYPFGRLDSITRDLNLCLHSGETVQKVLPDKSVLLADGGRELFDKVLIATGARALLPALKGLPQAGMIASKGTENGLGTGSVPELESGPRIEGVPASGIGQEAFRVFLMRTMDDARRMKQALERGDIKKAVVVGASMVGIKVAELLLNQGIEVTLADFASYLFPLAALEPVARELERRVGQRGVKFKWNSAIEEITEHGARFGDGGELSADLICLCVGTRANVELAANTEAVSGTVQIHRGIVVNSRMETSVPGIYAAGDCCEGTNLQTGETMIIGLWANAGGQGETAGKNMAGIPDEYPGNVVHNITHFMDMDFIGLGDPRLPGERVAFGELSGPRYVEAVVKDGRLQCVNIIGGQEESGIIKSLLMRCFTGAQATLAPCQRSLLLKAGYTDEFLQLLEGKDNR